MAKSKASKSKVTVESVENAIRIAVHKIPCINDLPESQYIDIYMEALELILDGLRCRQQELDGEANE